MAFWEKYGLVSPGWFRSFEPEPRYAALPRGTRFRLALEEKGGLFLSFGQFLAGRVDLLSSEYLYELRKIKAPELSSPGPIPDDLQNLVSDLQMIRGTATCAVYRGSYRGESVIVEVSYDGNESEKGWDSFRREIQGLNDQRESAVSRESVLQEFWELLRMQGDLARKRTMLTNLQDAMPDTVSHFPRIVSGLQSSRWMGYESTQGDPIDRLLSEADDKAAVMHVLAEGFLEQSLMFSLIDAEFHMGELLVLEKGRLGFRTVPAWVSVPVESHQHLLQYLVAAVAGDTPRAVQMLCKMSAGRNSYLAERRLLDELSSLQPELKVNAFTPESVTALETYCRALSKSDIEQPPFLRFFHRNITTLGQYNETVIPSDDLIDQALWPALGRLLRFHIAEVLSSGKAQEWAMSSSLFFMTAGRQVAQVMEKLRENDASITAEPDIRSHDSQDSRFNHRTSSVLTSAVFLVMFLFSLQFSMSHGGGPFSLIAGLTTAAAALILIFSVARIR